MATSCLTDILTIAPAAFSGHSSLSVIVENVMTTQDYYDGGLYYIDDYLIYNGSPASREINLFTKKDKRLIATTWSDPTTGYYRFDRLKAQEYFCVAFDYLKVFDHVSHDLIVEGP